MLKIVKSQEFGDIPVEINIVQITCSEHQLYALCSDGFVYMYQAMEKIWTPFSSNIR